MSSSCTRELVVYERFLPDLLRRSPPCDTSPAWPVPVIHLTVVEVGKVACGGGRIAGAMAFAESAMVYPDRLLNTLTTLTKVENHGI